MCAGWAWYLALDFRLFLTIPAILIFTTFFHPKKRKIVGMSICGILALATIIWSFHKIYQNQIWYTNFQDKNATNDRYYYTQASQRGVIYYMGCIFAYMTQKDGSKKPAPPAPAREGGAESEGKEALVPDAARKNRKRAKIVRM